jgi:hypothetical protein
VRAAIELLANEMNHAYDVLRERIEGLTDDEYFWEPVPNAWTVYQDESGRWTYHYELPEPDPSPFTTIGWRLTHVATCKVMYHEYAFGPGELTWPNIDVPGSAEEATRMLADGQKLLVNDLASLHDDVDLHEPRLTNWGEKWPTWKIFWTMVHHDAHHGGEIGVLRDLYRISGELH